jgi:hypothetical protein
LISNWCERSLNFLTEHEAAFPGTAGFISAVADARTAVASVAPSFSFTFHLDPNPEAMGADPALVFPRLLGEVEGWLGFFVHSVVFRIGHYVDDVVTGFNGVRPYRVVNAARSLLELSAVVHHHARILTAAAAKLSPQNPLTVPQAIEAIVATLVAATHFAQITRFNWPAWEQGDLDDFFSNWSTVDERVRATQILTLIDKLPGREKRAARFFYEMLCDFVHPNVASHTLVVDQAQPMGEGRMRWDLKRAPDSDEAFSFLTQAVAIPVRHSIQLLIGDLDPVKQVQAGFLEWKQRCENYALSGGKNGP